MFEVIKLLIEKEQVDPDRVYITGNSWGGAVMGAVVASSFMVEKKGIFAAAVPVACKGFGFDERIAKTVAVSGFVGSGDGRRVGCMQGAAKTFNEKGGYMECTVIPGAKHGNTFREALKHDLFLPWMLKQKRGQPKAKTAKAGQ